LNYSNNAKFDVAVSKDTIFLYSTYTKQIYMIASKDYNSDMDVLLCMGVKDKAIYLLARHQVKIINSKVARLLYCD
jgi:hypothetical protein